MGLCLFFVKERNILLSRQCLKIHHCNRIQMPQILHIVAGSPRREQIVDIIIKRTNYCFPTGVESSDTEPTFMNDLLIYQGRYYQIGVGHKEYAAEKVVDEDYYILTLAAIARELSREQIIQANVFLAAGLPLSWVAKQREAFRAYLLQNNEVEFTFRRKDYRIRIVGAAVYPQ